MLSPDGMNSCECWRCANNLVDAGYSFAVLAIRAQLAVVVCRVHHEPIGAVYMRADSDGKYHADSPFEVEVQSRRAVRRRRLGGGPSWMLVSVRIPDLAGLADDGHLDARCATCDANRAVPVAQLRAEAFRSLASDRWYATPSIRA
jgi:hypothetical protein